MKIDQDGYGARMFFFYASDYVVKGFEIGMIGMAHIDAEHIHTGQKQLLDHFFGVGRRPQCCDDLRLSLPSHVFTPSLFLLFVIV